MSAITAAAGLALTVATMIDCEPTPTQTPASTQTPDALGALSFEKGFPTEGHHKD